MRIVRALAALAAQPRGTRRLLTVRFAANNAVADAEVLAGLNDPVILDVRDPDEVAAREDGRDPLDLDWRRPPDPFRLERLEHRRREAHLRKRLDWWRDVVALDEDVPLVAYRLPVLLALGAERRGRHVVAEHGSHEVKHWKYSTEIDLGAFSETLTGGTRTIDRYIFQLFQMHFQLVGA